MGAVGAVGWLAWMGALKNRFRAPTKTSSGSEPVAPRCGERLVTNLEKQ